MFLDPAAAALVSQHPTAPGETPNNLRRGSGLLHTMLSPKDGGDVLNHSQLGAPWEGFALEHAFQHLNLRALEAFCWAAHTDGELTRSFSAQEHS